jgi:PPM family protein phosphatase
LTARPETYIESNAMTTLSAVPDDGNEQFRGQPSSLRLDVEFAMLSSRQLDSEREEVRFGSVAPSTPAQARSKGWFFVLADEPGWAAVEYFSNGFRRAAPAEGLSALLMRLAQEANATRKTALVACVLRYDRLVVAHAGDARCCLVRRRQARLLTRDPGASQGDSLVNIETSDIQIYPGDILLLCSDSFYRSAEPSKIAAILADDLDLDRAAEELMGQATARGGDERMSLQLVRVRSVERLAMHRRKAYLLR